MSETHFYSWMKLLKSHPLYLIIFERRLHKHREADRLRSQVSRIATLRILDRRICHGLRRVLCMLAYACSKCFKLVVKLQIAGQSRTIYLPGEKAGRAGLAHDTRIRCALRDDKIMAGDFTSGMFVPLALLNPSVAIQRRLVATREANRPRHVRPFISFGNM